jgi:hypothetical protein
MGVGYAELFVVLLLIVILGLLIFYLSRRILRKRMHGASDKRINLLSRLIAFLLAPVVVIGLLAVFIYVSIQSMPEESEEEIISNHYAMMEAELSRELKIGMSKKDVVSMFGESDTTQAVVIYDLSSPGAKEKYILELEFDESGLAGFKRHKADSVR